MEKIYLLVKKVRLNRKVNNYDGVQNKIYRRMRLTNFDAMEVLYSTESQILGYKGSSESL